LSFRLLRNIRRCSLGVIETIEKIKTGEGPSSLSSSTELSVRHFREAYGFTALAEDASSSARRWWYDGQWWEYLYRAERVVIGDVYVLDGTVRRATIDNLAKDDFIILQPLISNEAAADPRFDPPLNNEEIIAQLQGHQ